MTVNIRYRLIQIVEVLLWLGAIIGTVQFALRAWAVREQGWRTMLDIAAPGLLAIGAAMAGLLVLIGIYHNTRRHGEALERLAKQGAGGIRRLPGVGRTDTAAAAPISNRRIASATPVKERIAPVVPHTETTEAHDTVVTNQLPKSENERGTNDAAEAVRRGNTRRLGPAS
ncbi:hypothetical protein [Paracoccus albus]|uniref:hypothetical protein n=1 Tax=Paracoccus albus TaxID=3017784 RepID=UPI0022F0E8ED|nr:hypothetical protein [Paracoccus albus]WBU60509.1 hypothetical protein PAF20_00860 [Paracoccus albus]